MGKQQLAKGRTLLFEGPCHLDIEVTSGTVWATESPASLDHLFRQGETGHLVSKGPIVVEALSDAEVTWVTSAGDAP